jgi:hypothetical protein
MMWKRQSCDNREVKKEKANSSKYLGNNTVTKGIVKEETYKKVILILEKSNTHTQNEMLAYMYSEAITVQISTMRA